MKYKIHKKRRDAIIMFFVMPVAFLPLAAVIYLGGFEDVEMLLFTGAVSGAIFTGWSMYVHTCLRPSAKVDGEKVTYFPLWKKKRVIDIALIDKRTVFSRMDVDTYIYRSAGHTVRQRSKYTYDYSYFSGEKEVMRISSAMKNADRFDAMIKKQLSSEEE